MMTATVAGTGAGRWADYYEEVAGRRARLVSNAGPIVAGFSATTDALHRIADADLERVFAAAPTGSAAFDAGMETLRSWLAQGRDGELFIDDDEAEPLLEALVGRADKVQCGGTAIQACWSWSRLGLEPLLALRDRTARQLGATAPGVRIATADGVVPVGRLLPGDGAAVPSNHVLELRAGLTGGGVTVARSSRITVVMARKRLQLDDDFLERSPGLVRDGVALVSGLNGLGRRRSEVLPVVARAAAAWKSGGAALVHLELADYRRRDELAEVMGAVGPHVDSVGMNADELTRLVGDGDPRTRAAEFAEAQGIRRVVVHGDRWAMSVHRGDPVRERLALAAGSLAAAGRALTGEPQERWIVPAHADFAAALPAEGSSGPGWRVSVVATPYLSRPRSTIGLGDTFVSGDLLVQAATP